MELDKVIIKNFRQYRDVEVEFARDPEKNFTIIKGNNGTGKTTMLNALSWCLYGEEIHDYKDDSALSICNNKTLKLAEDNSDITVSVELAFIDDDYGELSFKRSRKFHKTSDDLVTRPFNDVFEIITNNDDNFLRLYGHACVCNIGWHVEFKNLMLHIGLGKFLYCLNFHRNHLSI